jgi:hypothetical protein
MLFGVRKMEKAKNDVIQEYQEFHWDPCYPSQFSSLFWASSLISFLFLLKGFGGISYYVILKVLRCH